MSRVLNCQCDLHTGGGCGVGAEASEGRAGMSSLTEGRCMKVILQEIARMSLGTEALVPERGNGDVVGVASVGTTRIRKLPLPSCVCFFDHRLVWPDKGR